MGPFSCQACLQHTGLDSSLLSSFTFLSCSALQSVWLSWLPDKMFECVFLACNSECDDKPSVRVDFSSFVYHPTPFGLCPKVVHCRPLQVGLKASECAVKMCGPNVRVCEHFFYLFLFLGAGGGGSALVLRAWRWSARSLHRVVGPSHPINLRYGSLSCTQRAWEFWRLLSLLSLRLSVHLLFCFLKPRTQCSWCATTPAPLCACSLCAVLKSQVLTVYTMELLARDTRSSLCVRLKKAMTVVFSSHTKRLDCLPNCVAKKKKKSVCFLPSGSHIRRHWKPLWFIFPLPFEKKKVLSSVGACVIVYSCVGLRVCPWIEMFSYSCEKCSQLLPHSEVETDGGRWRETK